MTTDFVTLRRKAQRRYERLVGAPVGLPKICEACGQRIEEWEPLSIVERKPMPLAVHRECRPKGAANHD